QSNGFDLTVSARSDGTVKAAYIRFRSGKVGRSREIIEDVLIADYDNRGKLLGAEILAPIKVSDLAKLVDESQRIPLRKFAKHSGSSLLVLQ
ncbi:MAG: DUF2283 domain-containing protein, partial [Isosphaeraceae bacterium]